MKAIKTKYLPATNTKPSRIKAMVEGVSPDRESEMEMPELVQKIESPAEELALQVAQEFHAAGQDAAGILFKKLCTKHNLTHGEADALSHVASCMIHGKRWKKCNKSDVPA